MSAALQIALFVTCVAVVLFVLFLIPLSILLYRRARTVARQLEEVKADLNQLIQDSRTMVQNVNLLSSRANQQLDEVGKELQKLQKLREKPRLAPIPLLDGTVSMTLLGTASGDANVPSNNPFVTKIRYPAKAALYGQNRASFSVSLDQEGAGLLHQLMDPDAT